MELSGDKGPTVTEPVFIEQEFVFKGVRFDGKKRFVALSIINEDGTLREEAHFDYKRSYVYFVGCVYSCKFSEDGSIVRGLDKASWLRQWDNEQAIYEWQAMQMYYQEQFARKKLEADIGRVNEIEQVMIPLREQYEKMRFMRNMAGCKALESAVIMALQTSLRKSERKE